ncbi:MAG: ester cyclase [Halobacteriota archaeon]
MTTAEERRRKNKRLAREVVDAVLNGQNPEAAVTLLSADLVVHALGGEQSTAGLESFTEGLAAWRSAVPDYEVSIESSTAEGNTVMLFCTARGTHEGAWGGFAPTGRRFQIAAFHRFRFADDRVAEWWRLTDVMAMLRQLGLLPDSPRNVVRFFVGQLKHRVHQRAKQR